MKHYLLTALAAASALSASAQMAKDNPCKFLGNITTSYNWQEYCDPQDNCGLKYTDYWDQVTNENASKWGSVHQGWGKFNWENSDRAYKYCKEHGIIFKFHALIWGSQAPGWIKGLSAAETRKAIEEWYDEVARHYPDLQIIDVVNEAIYAGSDYHSPYKDYNIIEALGGSKGGYPNTQSYDWIAEAFRMARKRWPNAVLIYNDYNTFRWQKKEFIDLINGLKACGAPIDAAGCQSHDLTDMSGADFKAALEDIHNKTQLPIYITEYDLGTSNDAHQKSQLEAQFPTMWEADYVPGVTFWGWIYGKTWTTDGNSGLVKNCQDRPAFTWLKQYMASDRAKNARATVCGKGGKGPVVAMEASKSLIVIGDSVQLSATLDGDITDIKHVQYLNGSDEIIHKWVSPFKYYWTPDKKGEYTITAKVFDANKDYTTQSVTIKVVEPNKPYGGAAAVIPGIIEAENYDEGVAGLAYYDKSEGNSCDDINDTYRNDDVDIKEIDGGYALGSCQEGEWMSYTVEVQEDGEYEVTMRLGEGNDEGKLSVEIDGQRQSVTIEKTGAWGTFGEVKLKDMTLTAGTKEMKITIDQDWIDLDWIKFECKSCKQEVVDTTEATVALHENTRVAVYPNPAKETITIAGVKGFKSASIINMLGVAVLTSETQVISVSNLPSGAYIVKIDGEEGEIVRNVVIKK